MAALYFPTSSSKFLSSSYYCHINAPSSSSYLLHLHLRPFQFCSIVCSATGRKSRKLISDADLCKNLLDFVSSIGMPAGYVPSTKELTEHGRKDLANIVRRRGYKFIRELLANSIGVANEPNLKESLTEGKIGIAEHEDTADEKVEDMPHEALDGSFLKEASILVNKTASTIEPAASLDYQVFMPVESSTVLSSLKSKDIFDERVDGSPMMEDPASDDEFVPAVSLEGGGISVESTVSLSLQVKDISDEAAGASFIEGAYIAESDSVSMHEDDQQCAGMDPSAVSSSLQGNDLSDETIAGLSFTTKDDSLKRPELGATVDDQHHVPVEHSTAGSLQEKVSAFMKYGKLDEIEDNLSRKVNGVADSGIYRHIDSSMGTESMVHGEGNLPHVGGGNDNIVMSRSVRTSSLTALPVVDNGFMRSNHSLAVGTKETKFEEDLNAESNKIESQVEVERLRVMLHQKELELSQLKEQIEKEKQTLSFLQAKAEAEINKAQKLILEKDAELYAAEESLSGLKEVQIQYFVEGKIVELAGSFNGWHQRIILDPQPSSDITDPVCSSFEKYISESKLTSFVKTESLDEHVGQRDWGTGFAKKERDKCVMKSRLWSTSLWLYPGVYEIKFIVDGEWTLDPQREITSRGGIQNNILRIER